MAKILECHSKGDKRFSPFFCQVSAFGRTDSIENHYQRSKVFEGGIRPTDWRHAKELQKSGLRQVGWAIGDMELPVKSNEAGTSFADDDWGVQWYVALWEKYLKANPELIKIAKQYDQFNDPFKRDFPMPQSVILEIVSREGIDELRNYWRKLFKEFKIYKFANDIQKLCGGDPELIQVVINYLKARWRERDEQKALELEGVLAKWDQA